MTTGAGSRGAGRAARPFALVALLATLLISLAGAPGARAEGSAGEDKVERAGTAAANAEGVESNREAAQEGEGAPAISGKSLALQLLNFGVLLAILVKFGGGAINKALAARHEQLKAEVAAAAAARAQAEARLRKQEERLAGLEREITAMRAGIKAEAEVEKAQMIAGAEERARRVREETTFVIEQQVKEAQVALRRDVADSALRIAEETLRRGVNTDDQRRLVEGFMSDVIGPEPLVTSGKGI